MAIQLNETRNIALPQGGMLEVKLSPEFLFHLSKHYAILLNEITDDHIRMFIWGATKSAIDKAENG